MSLVHHDWQEPLFLAYAGRVFVDSSGRIRYKVGPVTGDTDGLLFFFADGSVAMSGNLDMGTYAITNVGDVDGVDVSAFAAAYVAHIADGDAHHNEAHDLDSHGACTLAELNADISDTDAIGADGSVAMTGDLDMGSQHIKVVSGIGGLVGNAVIYLGPATHSQYNTLQSAVDALPAAGGLIYILPGYTETISTLVSLKSHVTIWCPTQDAEITAGIDRIIYVGGNRDDVHFHGIKFIGAGSGTWALFTSPNSAWRWRWTQCQFHDVACIIRFPYQRYKDFTFDGFKISGFVYHSFWEASSQNGTQRLTVKNGHVLGEGSGTFYYQEFAHNWRTVFDNIFIDDIAEVSYYPRHGSPTAKQEWRNCHARGCVRGFGRASGTPTQTDPIRYNNCTARYITNEGFDIDIVSELDNCRAIDCGYGGAGARDGISIAASADRTRLTNTSSYNKDTADQRYGVNIAAG
ncbi:unnamed protein product, partial [marine sediment metagenome]